MRSYMQEPDLQPQQQAQHTVTGAVRRTHRWPRRIGRLLGGLVALLALFMVVYALLIRPWHLRWGATDAEARAVLPGDSMVTHVWSQSTRAITIHAPVATVWPWLVQMGQGRGGFYSYAWLENLAGCQIQNASSIHPEWQNLKVGDLVRLYPPGGGPPPYTVAAIQPQAALLLGHHAPGTATAASSGGWNDSWAFVLQPIDARTTRLIVRGRTALTWSAAGQYMVEGMQAVMERQMLLGIRDRVEQPT